MLQEFVEANPLVGRTVLPMVVGFVAAIVNVVAGGGSLLTIPLLIAMGLPPQLANGTNRVGIWTHSVAGTTTFVRDSKLPWRYELALLPVSIG